MAITTTTINNGIAIGDAGHVGNSYLITRTALQAGSSFLMLEATLTNGAVNGDPTQSPTLRWAVSGLSITADATAVAKLAGCSQSMTIRPSLDTGGIRITQSPIQRIVGGYLYTWFEAPTLSAAASVILTANEF
jgi:hypothetical protein